MGRTLDELLADVRGRIERLTPAEAWAAAADGALIVDIRSDAARAAGVVPGSLHLPRTVLEWRVAPDSAWRSPYVGGTDTRIVLLCDHGCSSSFAAATLVELGFTRAGDIVGGFEAWVAGGLPVARPVPPPRSAAPPGLGPPEPADNAP
jgi:rhodanese-related sulfurtransferase